MVKDKGKIKECAHSYHFESNWLFWHKRKQVPSIEAEIISAESMKVEVKDLLD